VISPVGSALLLLGLIGLYARQSEATDVIGLISFLFALFGTVLALAGNVWGNLLAYLGWALFGVASLQARVYHSKRTGQHPGVRGRRRQHHLQPGFSLVGFRSLHGKRSFNRPNP
jgi:hypothetical protein